MPRPGWQKPKSIGPHQETSHGGCSELPDLLPPGLSPGGSAILHPRSLGSPELDLPAEGSRTGRRRRGLSAGVAERETPPFEFLRVVRSHVRERPEDVQVGGISCRNTQEEALVPRVLLASAQTGQREGNSLALWLCLWQPDFSELLVADTTSAPLSLNNPTPRRALSGEDGSPPQLTQGPVQTPSEGKEFRCPSSAFVIESPLMQEWFQICAAILEIIRHPHPINYISACMLAAWRSKAIFATNRATEFTFTW